MTLRELEIELKNIRENYIVRMVHSGKYTLQPKVIRNIDSGRNYYLNSFFNYAQALGFAIKINDILVTNLKELGLCLHSIRESANLKIRELKHPNRVGLREIIRLENGEGGSRDNLFEYLEMLESYNIRIEFDIFDKYGIKEFAEKLQTK